MTLAQQQQALLAQLFEPRRSAETSQKDSLGTSQSRLTENPSEANVAFHARGLLAYQSNGLELANRALAGAYPVMQQLIGEEAFAALAAALWQAHPPQRGDLAQWGDTLAQFVSHSAQLAEEAYLPDVARAEWALQQLKTAPDEQADLASLQYLMTTDPAQIRLCIAQTAQGLESRWPLASIWLAHQPQTPGSGVENPPGLEQVGALIRQGVAQTALVWRDGHRPRLREALPGEPGFLAALRQGESLEQAMQNTPLDFSAWLPLAAQSGLLLSAKLVPV